LHWIVSESLAEREENGREEEGKGTEGSTAEADGGVGETVSRAHAARPSHGNNY
jgi:hypothetical protein